MTFFHGVQRDIPNLEFSPSHVSIGFSQIAFPITVLPKDDRTDFAQEERLDLRYWTILGTCVEDARLRPVRLRPIRLRPVLGVHFFFVRLGPVRLWPVLGVHFFFGRLRPIRLRPIGPNRRFCVCLCVSAVCVCCVCVCVCGVCLRCVSAVCVVVCSPGPPLRRTAQNFAFFSLSRHNFHSFFSLLGVLALNFGGV